MSRLHSPCLGILPVLLFAAFAAVSPATAQQRPPNFVIIFCDDLGYGDIGPFGSTRHRTPNLDRMAAEGMRFTDFYSTSGVCSPSRSSLLTGCYPRRVGIHQNETGQWKLHLARQEPVPRKPGQTRQVAAELYDLENDVGEKNNVAAGHPEVVRRLETLAEACREDLGDGKRPGKNCRRPGHVEDAKTLTSN